MDARAERAEHALMRLGLAPATLMSAQLAADA